MHGSSRQFAAPDSVRVGRSPRMRRGTNESDPDWPGCNRDQVHGFRAVSDNRSLAFGEASGPHLLLLPQASPGALSAETPVVSARPCSTSAATVTTTSIGERRGASPRRTPRASSIRASARLNRPQRGSSPSLAGVSFDSGWSFLHRSRSRAPPHRRPRARSPADCGSW